MNNRTHHPIHADMVGIARQASLYDWLIRMTRSGRRPPAVPGPLHADLGLTPPQRERDWSGWRPFG